MRQRIYDYIFMCFFLGNDFLPHFPGLNIRTHGIFTLMDIYKRCIGHRENRFFIDMTSGRIQWHWVKALVHGLADQELGAIRHEYEARKKWETRSYAMNTAADRQNAFENVPTLYRAEEHYICPFEPGWETRYYQTAFGLQASASPHNDDHGRPPPAVPEICANYLEGLEWVFRYYTAGCPDWKWRYEFHYPPLFADLVRFIPDFETEFLSKPSLQGANTPKAPSAPRVAGRYAALSLAHPFSSSLQGDLSPHTPPFSSSLQGHLSPHTPPFSSSLQGANAPSHTPFSSLSTNRPFHPYTQLLCVLPRWNHALLPAEARRIADKIDGFYVELDQLRFQWMFCKYFWESHAFLPKMSVKDMELIDLMFWTAET
jgi:5'-3' exonuclease